MASRKWRSAASASPSKWVHTTVHIRLPARAHMMVTLQLSVQGAKKIWGFSLWQGRLKKKEQERRERYDKYEEVSAAPPITCAHIQPPLALSVSRVCVCCLIDPLR